MLNANSRGDKYFKGVQIYQKVLFWGSKYFNKTEINYLGVQIFQYIWTGGAKNGVHLSHDRSSILLCTYLTNYLPCELCHESTNDGHRTRHSYSGKLTTHWCMYHVLFAMFPPEMLFIWYQIAQKACPENILATW